ncbi:LTA synthase family protein [Sphingomonas colocasiae]|uniref:Sulfatase-like hydrolase/transferase n=1 Tax=Sphingomonas colocasiae TaxID=1848973 RepID=A0ABS7PMK5_9SPHN|nr:sulfatase-like hydrolase/transferase [Sphingomonas colocasiae]MBY8822493.1 sulfatase-like hydrolase/transferase [Sphingomonas colocasiae]
MQTERRRDLWTLAFAFVLTKLFELVLVERKFAIFGGGYGQSHVLDTPGEIATFAISALAGHALLLGVFFLILRRLHGRLCDPLLFRFSLLFFGVAAFSAALIAKFEVLSYFSDAVSFELIRNLGGGSLFDAFLFALSEGGLILGIAAIALLFYLVCVRYIRRRAGRHHAPPALKIGRWVLILAVAMPLVAAFANRDPDVRYGLTRMTAYGLANMILEQATDFDRDGYGWYSAHIDRHPFDATRHPLALDIPGNGIDEDGFGGDLVFTGPDPVIATPRLQGRPKHLVIVVMESTRGDVIGKRINGRPVAPNLNALAQDGSLFPRAYSHVGFTTASLKSLFSGRLDPRTGDPSLFTDLKANGYRIGVFSGQPESFGDISAVVGMQRSADIFVDAETLKDERALNFAAKGSLRVDETKLLREFDRGMGDKADWTRPHFVYFNFQSPHFPYHHPGLPDTLGIDPLPRDRIGAENAARVQQTYWNAVAYADAQLGAVIARLKALGVWEDTLLAVTGDHGEALFENGFLGHGHVIDPDQTHIPLVLSLPGLGDARPLGLKDMRGLFLAALGGTAVPTTAKPTFLHIGPLDAPTAIGIVEAGGAFTTLTLDTEDMWFGDTGRRARYSALSGADRVRADRLITEWGRQRWMKQLERR